MLTLLPTFLLLALACLTSGAWLRLIQGRNDPSLNVFYQLGFQGLCGITTLSITGGIFSIFFPLQWISAFIIPILALGGILLTASQVRKMELPVRTLLPVGLLGCFVLVFSARTSVHGDTGLYHLNAVLWLSENGLPLGLANLHGRFGFNSAWWNFVAWAELPWVQRGHSVYFPTGILGLFYGMLVAGAFRNLVKKDLRPADAIPLLSSFLWFRQVVGLNNPSISTDAPANLYILASATAAAIWLAERDKDSSRTPLILWIFLAASAASFKLTGLPWWGLSGLLLIGLCLRDPGRLLRHLLISGAASLPVLVYAVRGVLISGYPLYPLKLFGLDIWSWKVPETIVENDTSGIRDWPTRGNASDVIEFVSNWIQNQFGMINIIVGAVLIAGAAIALGVLFLFGDRGKLWHSLKIYAPVGVIAGLGLTVGFIFAPALRFVSGYFFTAVGVAGAIALFNWEMKATWLRNLACVSLIGCAVAPNSPHIFRRPVSVVAAPELPEYPIVPMKTEQGETVYVAPEGFSWESQLPTTINFNSHLMIDQSERGSIRKFKIEDE